jgi:predicted CXXCH cytochrome family protein
MASGSRPVALDSWGGQTGTVFWGAGHKDVMGTDLTDDHPISFTYNAALAGDDGGLVDPETTASGLGGTIEADLLFNGRLECASCHDPHDELGNDRMLRLSNAGSAFCLACHEK